MHNKSQHSKCNRALKIQKKIEIKRKLVTKDSKCIIVSKVLLTFLNFFCSKLLPKKLSKLKSDSEEKNIYKFTADSHKWLSYGTFVLTRY